MKAKVISDAGDSLIPTESKIEEEKNIDDSDESEDIDSDMDPIEEDTTDADDEDDEFENEEDAEANDQDEKSGWADAMAKVLKSAKTSKPTQVVLSKARKDGDVKTKIPDDKEDPEEAGTEENKSKNTRVKQSIIRSHKLAIESVGRQIPNVVRDKAKEKSLNKIATKGVVQLFNAVKKQQVDLKKDLNCVGKSIRKREKVYQSLDKDSFLKNVLGAKSGQDKAKKISSGDPPGAKQEANTPEDKEEAMDVEEESSKSTSWSALRDDFMIGAKMKDWDKNSDSEG